VCDDGNDADGGAVDETAELIEALDGVAGVDGKALLAVGEGRRESAWCATLLDASMRSSDYSSAPARGLTLVAVDYPPDDQMAARVAVTRDRRDRD
jgi:hypothetical protein